MMELDEYLRKNILLQEDKYQWLIKRLTKLDVQVRRIADFGCGEGRETLALMCLLEASEAAGVEKDIQSIRNAQGTLRNIQNIILAKGMPNDAPGFLRKTSVEEVVKFYLGDITGTTHQLLPNYYDIAFCDYVLYHIWLDQGGESSAQKAIEEMARVVKLGGLVAAREPTRRTDEQTFSIDFRPLFERAGLKPVHIAEIAFECGQNTKHIYIKESAS
jgi:SAM-dependent methyltransferase